MKKFFLLASIAMLGISCKKDIATPPITEPINVESAVAARGVNATPFSYSQRIPVQGYAWNGCTYEYVFFSGTQLVEVRGVISDNKLTFILHTNYSNVKATGLTSGIVYVTTEEINYSNTFNFNTQFDFQQVYSLKFIAPGGNNNFTLDNSWHLTVNANGVETIYFNSFDVIKCQ